MREAGIEKKLKAGVEKLGGVCLKLTVLNLSGVPDRLILLPGGRVKFIELKTDTGIPSKLQTYWVDKLTRLGFDARILYGVSGVAEYLRELSDAV